MSDNYLVVKAHVASGQIDTEHPVIGTDALNHDASSVIQRRPEGAAPVYRAGLGLDDTLVRSSQHPGNVWSLHGYAECCAALYQPTKPPGHEPNSKSHPLAWMSYSPHRASAAPPKTRVADSRR